LLYALAMFSCWWKDQRQFARPAPAMKQAVHG
jgi:hypothetical protein